ncbi:hypothetical protein C8R43DRAFT_838613, partial [Mycena crocata]
HLNLILMSSNDNDLEETRLRTAACQKFVDDCVIGRFSTAELVDKLRSQDIPPEAAQDFVKQAVERIANLPVVSLAIPDLPTYNRASTPDNMDEDSDEYTQFQERRRIADEQADAMAASHRDAVVAASWAVIRAKAAHADPSALHNRDTGISPAALLGNLFTSSSLGSGSILSPAILKAAPHLAALSAPNADPHLETTSNLRQLFAQHASLDAFINVMQSQKLLDPIPRAIWRDIILDRYVNFEKLFASLGAEYDHQEEYKDFLGGYALVKKDHLVAKRRIETEAEWLRVFACWEAGVVLIYPHRAAELRSYQLIVTELFRVAPTRPLVAIRFDHGIRERYSKSPFKLDDRSQRDIPLLEQMFALSSSSSPSSSTLGVKRPASTTGTSSSKRTAIIVRPAGPSSRLVDPSHSASDNVIEALKGPRQLASSKRKADDSLDAPRHRRGFVWSSTSVNNISPSALYTESAPPLPSPPQRLLDNPEIQAALDHYSRDIHHDKPRVVTDHASSGLNDGIPKEAGKVKYDDMRPFGQCMRDARMQNPGCRLVLYKDDVAKAFLNLPAHPIWQLRQVVIVDGVFHIVRRLLLILWEAIGCPFEDEKQMHGTILKIIGFEVDINLGSISLTPSSITDIVEKIRIFLSHPGRNPILRDWQRLGGHLNWLLNVLPWGRPALS